MHVPWPAIGPALVDVICPMPVNVGGYPAQNSAANVEAFVRPGTSQFGRRR